MIDCVSRASTQCRPLPPPQHRPRRRQARNRHPERRAADVVQPHLLAERDAPRIGAVLATNPQLQLRPRLPPAFGRDAHQLAHARDVQAQERVRSHDPLICIRRQNRRCVVARQAQRGLCQVVGAEREKLGVAGDLARRQGRLLGQSLMHPNLPLEQLLRQPALPDDCPQRPVPQFSVIGYGHRHRVGAGLPLHDDVAAALTHALEPMRRKDRTRLATAQDAQFTHAQPRFG